MSDNVKDLIYDFYQSIEKQYKTKSCSYGLLTQFYDFDALTGGFHPSELTVIASRQSMGKTSFAINIVNNLVTQGNSVLYVSYEMNNYFLAARLLSSYAEIDNMRLKKGCLMSKDWEKLAIAMDKLSDFSDNGLLNIISSCQLTWEELFDEIRFFANNNPDGIVFIDYFQLIKLIGNTDRIIELSTLAGAFKRLTLELNIPFIILSQITKKTKDVYNKRPSLEDISECDALAQHADNVVFIYRQDYYQHEDFDDDIKTVEKGSSEIIIAKQKNGPVGTIKLLYQDNICKFKNPIKTDNF